MRKRKKRPIAKDGRMSKEMRARFEAALAKREEETKPLRDAIRDSERITAEDLAVYIGPGPNPRSQ